jgi:hypothetical protein
MHAYEISYKKVNKIAKVKNLTSSLEFKIFEPTLK